MRLAVLGDPVAHSRSPALQRGFFAEFALEGTYEAIRVPAGTLRARLADLRAGGFHGVNVTTPLKEEAYACADTRDAAARASGAVNTLLLGARIDGFNTDGIGACGALAAAGMTDLTARRILILGAGPTARAAAVALLDAGAHLLLWNRTRERGQRFARASGAHLWAPGTPLAAVFSTLPPQASPEDAALLAALREAPLVIDANYGERATLGSVLERPDVIDGSAMLRASARASFELFRRGGDSNSRDL